MIKAKLSRLVFNFEVPIYGRQVLVLIGHNCLQAVRVLTALKDSEEYIKHVVDTKDAGGLTVQRSDGNVLIWLPMGISGPREMATAEHERRHATDCILTHIGFEHPVGTSETHCYLQQWIAERMWSELVKYVGYSF